MGVKSFFLGKFSVGFCLSESMERLASFFESNRPWINSAYFSLPLGLRFYSRESLADEYDDGGKKLFEALALVKSLGIRREMAINTWNLSEEELAQAVRFCKENDLYPEEIVCLRAYGKILSESFPDAEIKYSFNNSEGDGSHITRDFHTLVAGKRFLRDMSQRHAFLEKGYNVTLLLNNGCISSCRTDCNSIRCRRYFDTAFNDNGLNYTYALCSFFPSELKYLLECDPFASRYKFKISNRPLGLDYTQQALSAYISLEDPWEAMAEDWRKLGLFCTARPLARRMQEVNLAEVKRLKETWIAEMQNDRHW